MKAIKHSQYGPPEVLTLQEVPQPVPGPNEVLIRIRASTVNRTDDGFLRAKPFIVRAFAGLTKPKYTITGSEFAGEIVEVNSDSNEFKVGDRVCGFKDDDYGFGCHAEFTTMSVSGLIAKISDSISFKQAAPAMEGAHYALNYIKAANIKKGQSVFVNGGTGAIGSAAIQIVSAMGATVMATSRAQHMDIVRGFGAKHVIDYEKEDFTDIDDSFDHVLDAVGKSTFGRCKHLIKDGGTYSSSELGPRVENLYLPLWTKLLGTRRVLFPMPKNLKEDGEYLTELMAEGKYMPLIDRSYKLSEVPEAFTYVNKGQKIGNVVIEID